MKQCKPITNLGKSIQDMWSKVGMSLDLSLAFLSSSHSYPSLRSHSYPYPLVYETFIDLSILSVLIFPSPDSFPKL